MISAANRATVDRAVGLVSVTTVSDGLAITRWEMLDAIIEATRAETRAQMTKAPGQATQLADQLREAAAGTTEGPWKAESTVYEHMIAEIRATTPGSERGIAQVWQHAKGYRDARFMALANPANILTILDELASVLEYRVLANRDLAKVYDENQILLTGQSADQDRIRALEAENARLDALLNTPETAHFVEGVMREVPHQRERWGEDHDAGKGPLDWLWLLGHLVNKAAAADIAGDIPKAQHHTISSASALANWHAALAGHDNRMRPGIDAEALGYASSQPTPQGDA